MTALQYYELATEFRSRAVAEKSPAFRAELEHLAECYEWAAEESLEEDATACPARPTSVRP